MFGIGFPELLVILVVALLVVGPTKLPDLARSLGRAFGEFRKMADDVKGTLEDEALLQEEPENEPPKESDDSETAKTQGKNEDASGDQKA